MPRCKKCEEARRSAANIAQTGVPIQTPETTEVRSWTSLPLLDVANIPDDLDLIGGSNSEYRSWRVPAAYFLAGGSYDNLQHVFTMENGPEVPPHSVLPVLVNHDSGNLKIEAAKADSTDNVATSLVVAVDGEKYTLMGSGYFKFNRPHLYTIGKTYYLSQEKAGEVVSCRPTAGVVQPLFTVIDATTIFINVTLM